MSMIEVFGRKAIYTSLNLSMLPARILTKESPMRLKAHTNFKGRIGAHFGVERTAVNTASFDAASFYSKGEELYPTVALQLKDVFSPSKFWNKGPRYCIRLVSASEFYTAGGEHGLNETHPGKNHGEMIVTRDLSMNEAEILIGHFKAHKNIASFLERCVTKGTPDFANIAALTDFIATHEPVRAGAVDEDTSVKMQPAIDSLKGQVAALS